MLDIDPQKSRLQMHTGQSIEVTIHDSAAIEVRLVEMDYAIFRGGDSFHQALLIFYLVVTAIAFVSLGFGAESSVARAWMRASRRWAKEGSFSVSSSRDWRSASSSSEADILRSGELFDVRNRRVHPQVGQAPERATHRAEAHKPQESTPRAHPRSPKPIGSRDKPVT